MCLQRFPGSWVQRQDDRTQQRDVLNDLQHICQIGRGINIVGPVKCGYEVVAGAQTEQTALVKGSGAFQLPRQRVDHDVPHKECFARYPLIRKIDHARRLRHEQQV